MSWRLRIKDTQGNESVIFTTTRREALVRARELLVDGHAVSRLESDDGEILEGKQLQEALTAQPDLSKMH